MLLVQIKYTSNMAAEWFYTRFYDATAPRVLRLVLGTNEMRLAIGSAMHTVPGITASLLCIKSCWRPFI